MLLVVTDDGRLLLHLRDDKPGILHPGCWAGFGGRVEGNESIEEALRREVLEETGIELNDAEFLVNECDHEGDGDRLAMFVARGIRLDDIELQEGAGVGVHSFDELGALKMSPFVRRAIVNNLRPLEEG